MIVLSQINWPCYNGAVMSWKHISGFMQGCAVSIANPLEIPQSCESYQHWEFAHCMKAFLKLWISICCFPACEELMMTWCGVEMTGGWFWYANCVEYHAGWGMGGNVATTPAWKSRWFISTQWKRVRNVHGNLGTEMKRWSWWLLCSHWRHHGIV